MDKLVSMASEIAKRGTFHAYHHRVAEAVYLYRLSVVFIDRVLDAAAASPASASSASTVEFLRDARHRYLSYIEANSPAAPATPATPATPPSRIPSPGVPSSPLVPKRSQSLAIPVKPSPAIMAASPSSLSTSSPPTPPAISLPAPSGRAPAAVASSPPMSAPLPPQPSPSAALKRSASGISSAMVATAAGVKPAPPVASSVADLRLLRDAVSASRSVAPEEAATALKKAEEAKKSSNLAEAIRQYEIAVECLLRSKQNAVATSAAAAAGAVFAGGAIAHKTVGVTAVKRPLPTPAPSASQAKDKEKEQDGQGLSGMKGNPTSMKATLLSTAQSLATIDFVNDTVEFHERLGGGGSGATIMRATSRGFTFAAKVLMADVPPEVMEAVLWEIVVMTKLEHPNVVKYLGHDLTKQNKICLFMEFYTQTLSGILRQRREQEKHLSAKEITNWAFQIAKGLSYLHNLDPPLIHRDLKADNVFVLLDSQDRVEILKIGDFDTAKIVAAARVTFTKNLGTVGFMAPEVCAPSDKGYDDKADIWSFGMVLYEMMQLEVPYYNIPPLQRYEMQMKGEIPTLDLGDRAVSLKDLVAIFHKCTQKTPATRPTAKKLVKSLASLL